MNNVKSRTFQSAFTLIEILVVIGILLLVMLTSFTLQTNKLIDTPLETKTNETVEMLRLAQVRSLTRYKDSQWGVYFNANPAADDKVVLFKGATYATRDAAYDIVSTLPSVIWFSSITLSGGGSEIDFTKFTGLASTSGTVIILSARGTLRTLSTNSMGIVDVT